MTIESFAMIENNFVGDLLSMKQVPDQIKQALYIYFHIVGFKCSINDGKFWTMASEYLRKNEKEFRKDSFYLSQRPSKNQRAEVYQGRTKTRV